MKWDRGTYHVSNGVVRAGGLEPPQAFRPYGFSYQLRLSPLAPRRSSALRGIRGLDYTFTVAFAVGAARLVSTPSPFRAWLGIAM